FELKYTLPEQADVILSVYDIAGKVVSRISEVKQPGIYTENIDMYGKPTGVYFIRMEANGSNFIETRKVLLVE
ncbi:MAG: T9SS type A sorting domain-containing protein, partial [candidate division WOR-3 bacterium]